MAPIRRYLRITKHSVIECRIYLESPSLVETWFLNARDPVLPRVIESVRPLILPKLREENERSRARAKKAAKAIKDVVVEDEFEVALFLTEPSTRHSLLKKEKYFLDPHKRIKRSDRKLTSLGNHAPANDSADANAPIVIREEDDETDVPMQDIPPAVVELESEGGAPAGAGRRRRHQDTPTVVLDRDDDVPGPDLDPDLDPDPDLDRRQTRARHRQRERRTLQHSDSSGDETYSVRDDKKKLVAQCSYDGYSIYGRILCLVVKRRATARDRSKANAGPAMMEEWIVATQTAE
ncbi:MAG: hypothetical protein M1815_001831 [Lichina confinis]|nr:MAG: hypothetical protein M1815_001831 [Lichina confinis]